ncbi:MAG: hypothetical protein V9E89_08805 [Ilumatobacteraceae bacterium]
MSDAVVDLGPLIASGAAGHPALDTPLPGGSHPIALLPVRLETRFVQVDGGATELPGSRLPGPGAHRRSRSAVVGGRTRSRPAVLVVRLAVR